ncbi:MAG: ATP-binding protein [Betaproteobacteria bacterium]|jgi:two-component system osmolarity sensor histidine kinase EnvZ|nr:ATP-binding protein [Betaproteobacteria bacterium]
MRLIPQSLLARTALVLLFALMASQLVSIALFRYYSREPRVQLAAIGFVGQLKTIRAALEIIPPEQQREFLQRLRDERGMPVFRLREEEPMEIAPDIPALRVARERLREEFGSESEIFVRMRPQKPDAPPLLITRLPVRAGVFYVVFPRGRVVEQDFTWAWVGWGVFGGVIALAGAVFLMWRVNQPLKALAGAAQELGRGHSPPPVTEAGPTEVRAVAVAFNQMRRDLERVERERATFLAGVSHDLRTPLSRLRLGVEMLPADPATRSDIERDIADISGVVDQFMDFARDEGTEILEPTDLNRYVEAIADRARRAGADITLELGVSFVAPIRRQAFKRLLNNLIDNAVKHAKTAITIRLQPIAYSAPGTCGVFSISVLDRGQGIALDQVERLKQPFTRLDSSRTGASGAGLGLAIVERIAKIHNATFELLPREGGGTEARVTFRESPVIH